MKRVLAKVRDENLQISKMVLSPKAMSPKDGDENLPITKLMPSPKAMSLKKVPKQAKLPQYISDLVKFYSDTKQIKVLYGEVIKEEYEWLHSILKSKTANTVNIANIAVLFHKAEVITFVLTEHDNIRTAEWKALTTGMILRLQIR